MDIFVGKGKTKNQYEILFCGICSKGMGDKCLKRYKDGLLNLEIKKTSDEYFLDVCLTNIVVSLADENIKAVGASIFMEGIELRSGGIIGNPFSEVQSADDEIEILGDNLFCIAFSGRIGMVFQGSESDGIFLKEKLSLIMDNENNVIVSETVKIIDLISDKYILVSDGSGKGGYPYVCGRSGKNFYEKRLAQN